MHTYVYDSCLNFSTFIRLLCAVPRSLFILFLSLPTSWKSPKEPFFLTALLQQPLAANKPTLSVKGSSDHSPAARCYMSAEWCSIFFPFAVHKEDDPDEMADL